MQGKHTPLSVITMLLLFLPVYCAGQDLVNPGLDSLNAAGMPAGWLLTSSIQAPQQYAVNADSLDIVDGNYSLKIRNDSGAVWLYQTIDNVGLDANSIALTGWVKLSSGDTASAKLFIRLAGIDSVLAYRETNIDTVGKRNGWARLQTKLAFDKERVRSILVGVVLRGKTSGHFDAFRLLADGLPVSTAKSLGHGARADTTYSQSSGVYLDTLSPRLHQRLYEAGMIWSFLKYHHPSFTAGNKNADVALFELLKIIHKPVSQPAWHKLLEQWVRAAGPIQAADQIHLVRDTDKQYIQHRPHYGSVLEQGALPDTLYHMLMGMRQQKSTRRRGYYADVTDQIGNIHFDNERPYDSLSMPDEGLRLLALFRYWGMINYFYPYRESLANWDKTLYEMVPVFLGAVDMPAYTRSCLQLISTVHDSHAFVRSATLEKIKGKKTVPFLAAFVEQRLVITRYNAEYNLAPGDIILKINHTSVSKLTDSFKTMLSASNEVAYLRELSSPFGYLFRSNDSLLSITVRNRTATRTLTIRMVDADKLSNREYNDLSIIPPPATASKWLQDSIGYLYAGALSETNFRHIMDGFRQAKGLIIDMRCYPSLFVPYRLTNILKTKPSDFCYTTVPDIDRPGRINVKKHLSCGPDDSSITSRYPVVVLVNEQTQSQSEFTTMALSTIPKVTVLGSQTAGADGNYTRIILPGGFYTGMSGTGIYYPDGQPTQRVGIRIDKLVRPTIKGIAAGKDEQLDAAIRQVRAGR